MGEIFKKIKSWVLQATRGRYQPPSRKARQDLVHKMRANTSNTSKKLLIGFRKDNVLSSFPGKLVYF
jgi:hypothetical protein